MHSTLVAQVGDVWIFSREFGSAFHAEVDAPGRSIRGRENELAELVILCKKRVADIAGWCQVIATQTGYVLYMAVLLTFLGLAHAGIIPARGSQCQ